MSEPYVPKSQRKGYFKKKAPLWIEKASERIARMVCARGRFRMRDMTKLPEEIEKIMIDVKEEWGD